MWLILMEQVTHDIHYYMVKLADRRHPCQNGETRQQHCQHMSSIVCWKVVVSELFVVDAVARKSSSSRNLGPRAKWKSDGDEFWVNFAVGGIFKTIYRYRKFSCWHNTC